MSKTNRFSATVECPHCHSNTLMIFEADIGVLEYEVFDIGDLVIKTIPLLPRRGKHPKPIGPDLNVDWERAFWAVGFGRCPVCGRDVTARIEIRELRFSAARPTLENLDLFAWGPLDGGT